MRINPSQIGKYFEHCKIPKMFCEEIKNPEEDLINEISDLITRDVNG